MNKYEKAEFRSEGFENLFFSAPRRLCVKIIGGI